MLYWIYMKNLFLFLLLIIAVLGGWYYLKPKTQVIPTQTIKLDQSAAPANLTVIKMTGEKFRFTPDTITVKKGQPIRIILSSVDMPHNFVVDELGVKGEIVKPGQTGNTDFIPTQIGDFEFYCSVGNHRAMGMVGTLKVTD